MENIKFKIDQVIEYWQFDEAIKLYEKHKDDFKKNDYIKFLLNTGQIDKIINYKNEEEFNRKSILDILINNDFIKCFNVNIGELGLYVSILHLIFLLEKNSTSLNELLVLYKDILKLNSSLAKNFVTWKIVNYYLIKDDKNFFIFYPQKLTSFVLTYLSNQSSNSQGANMYYNLMLAKIRTNIKDKIHLGHKGNFAFCFYGCFRGDWVPLFERSLNTILKIHPNADIFVFTWKHYAQWLGFCGGLDWGSRYENQYIKNKIPQCIKSKEKLINHFPNVACKIQQDYLEKIDEKVVLDLKRKYPNIKKIILKDQFEFCECNNDIIHPAQYITYCLYKGFETIRYYEKEHGKEYDYIGMIRSDSRVLNMPSKEELSQLKNNEVFATISNSGASVGGANSFFIGTRTAIMDLSRWHFYWMEIQKNGLGITLPYHENLMNYCILSNIKIIPHQALQARHQNTIALVDIWIPDIQEEVNLDLASLKENHKLNYQEIQECEVFFKNLIDNVKKVSKTAQTLDRKNNYELLKITMKDIANK
ncbi:hypothetical protein [Campylobacter coli]|uniref:hypothetical protein n=1 Tax=Campylobacter coli TaxID=195 RepID=UPI00073EDFB8|nr:hypothetical protein [Campylobacter coli]